MAAEPPPAVVDDPSSKVADTIESRARIRSGVGVKNKSEIEYIGEVFYLVGMSQRLM